MSPGAGSNADDPNRPSWQNAIIAERMAVDRAFADQVAASSLSNESWELVMTAVKLEIRDPADPAEAELVANTERLPSVLSAIGEIERRTTPGSPGLGERLRDRVPGLSGPTEDRRRTAEALAGAYAQALRAELESEGRWEEACQMADGDDPNPSPSSG